MSKPSKEPDDWSGQSAALFDAARGAHAPSAVDRERVRSALAEKIAAASGAPLDGGEMQAPSVGSGTSGAAFVKLAKIGLGVVCTLAAAAAFMRAGDAREQTAARSIPVQTVAAGAPPALHAAEPEAVVASAAAAPSGTPEAAAAARVASPSPARPVAPPAGESSTPAKVTVSGRAPERSATAVMEQPAPAGTRSRPSPHEPGRSVARAIDEVPIDEHTPDARAEIELVARINAAVRASTPRAVLALCAEHERRWPHGTFEPEREGARAIASCRSKAQEAGARARAFLASYPRTAIAARVRQECAALLNERDELAP